LSRDPVEGLSRQPERFHPYAFAHNNAFVYSDPSGGFTLSEINVVSAIQSGLNTFRTASAVKARQFFVRKLTELVKDQLISQLKGLIPLDDAFALGGDWRDQG